MFPQHHFELLKSAKTAAQGVLPVSLTPAGNLPLVLFTPVTSFPISVLDTGGHPFHEIYIDCRKLAAIVNDLQGKLPPVSAIPEAINITVDCLKFMLNI